MRCVSLGLTGLLRSVMVMLITRSSYTLPKWFSTFRQFPKQSEVCQWICSVTELSLMLDRLLMQDRINASTHTSLVSRQHGYGSRVRAMDAKKDLFKIEGEIALSNCTWIINWPPLGGSHQPLINHAVYWGVTVMVAPEMLA